MYKVTYVMVWKLRLYQYQKFISIPIQRLHPADAAYRYDSFKLIKAISNPNYSNPLCLLLYQ